MFTAPLRVLARLERATIRRVLRLSRWERWLLVSVVVYGVVFSVLTALRVLALSAFAYDLGIYNQSLYTTVADGRFFYYTADLPANPGGSIFGAHFSPILILMLGPYLLAPSVFTLTVLQTWAIAFGAIPTFYLARIVLRRERMSFAFALVYLLHPATQGVNWYDFHPEAFLLLFLPLVLYAMESRRWRLFVAASLGTLTTIEVAPVLLLVIVAGEILASAWNARSRGQPMSRAVQPAAVLVAVASTVWYFAATRFLLSMNPVNVFFAGGAGYWSTLGAPSLVAVYPQALLHPDRALAALVVGGPLKAWYLVVLFAPFLFLPLRSPRGLLYCVPWLGVALLSDTYSFFLVGNQYPSFVLPFVLYAALLGLARPWAPAERLTRRLIDPLRRAIRRDRTAPAERSVAWALIAATCAVLVLASPLGPVGAGNYAVGGWPVLDRHAQAVDALYALIPPSASVLTQGNLFPLVSSRLNAFVIPVSTFYPPGTSVNATITGLLAQSDFVLLDYVTSPWESALIYAWPGIASSFQVRAAGDGAVLLQRGYSGPPSFLPYVRGFSSSQVVPVHALTVNDPAGTTGQTIEYSAQVTADFWYGPFAFLPPGAYRVTYRLRVSTLAPRTMLQLPVLSHPVAIKESREGTAATGYHEQFSLVQLSGDTNLSILALTAKNVPAYGVYFDITSGFSVTSLATLEFPGLAASPTAGLFLDTVTITQTAAYASATAPWIPPPPGP